MRLRLYCKLIRQDVATANGRVYSREALARIAALSNQQSLENRCLLAADVPPDASTLKLADVVANVENCTLFDGGLHIDVCMLDTEKGKPLKALSAPLVEKAFSVVPIMFGTTPNGMNVDPYSITFKGWSLVR